MTIKNIPFIEIFAAKHTQSTVFEYFIKMRQRYEAII